MLVQDAFAKLMKAHKLYHCLTVCQPFTDADLLVLCGDIVEHGNHHDLMARKGKYYQTESCSFLALNNPSILKSMNEKPLSSGDFCYNTEKLFTVNCLIEKGAYNESSSACKYCDSVTVSMFIWIVS